MSEILLKFKGGIDADNKVSLGETLDFQYLQNISMYHNLLVCESKPRLFAKLVNGISEVVENIAVIIDKVPRTFWVGLITNKAIYTVKDVPYELEYVDNNDESKSTLYYSNRTDVIPELNIPYAKYDDSAIVQVAQWLKPYWASCYITAPGLPMTRIRFDSKIVHTLKPSYLDENNKLCYLSAKYILTTNNRIFLANCYEDKLEENTVGSGVYKKIGTQHWPTRIHWSDIGSGVGDTEDPDVLATQEYFAVEEASDADYFDLGVNEKEITGLAFSQDITWIFTSEAIWRADYESFDEKFKTVKFSSIGCTFHYSVITVDDFIYFVGKDNFYSLSDLTITPIGDSIWSWFVEHQDYRDFRMIAQYDRIKNRILWSFNAVENGVSIGNIQLAYSRKHQTWSVIK